MVIWSFLNIFHMMILHPGMKSNPHSFRHDSQIMILYTYICYRMAGLDSEMEKEIDDLRRRYHAKRQPILDAMDQKRKRQQNF